MTAPDLALVNGRITTLDPARPEARSLVVSGGRVTALDDDAAVASAARVIDLRGRRAVPGLNDSHLHVIRAGLYYDLELRWDGLPSLADALRRLKEQAERTPPPHWVRVVGGWNEWQFAERRMPTLSEINAAAPDTPVMVLRLYDCALLNRAALRALGMEASAANPPGGLVVRDASGRPTGLLVAEPNAFLLYSTLAKAPKLPPEEQASSSLRFQRELNRFGVTSASDAGGGWQRYPDDYAVIRGLAASGSQSVRIAYSLFAQEAGHELRDYSAWTGMAKPGEGDELLRLAGAGENLAWSAADFENFLQPRPELRPVMEQELEAILLHLARAGWPFRIHATYDESIARFLAVIERVHREVPLHGLRWFLDHAETISPASLERVAALGGGIAIQHRMAYQGEAFARRYGAEAAAGAPPLRRLLASGVPVGAGTDGTRVATWHPWTCLWWLVSGRTVGGTRIAAPENRLDRLEALRLWTQGSAWFSGEGEIKGTLAPGRLADVAVLDADYFAVEEDEIRSIESVLTLLGGRVVHASQEHAALAPPDPPAAAPWMPAARGEGFRAGALPTHAHQPPVAGADGRLWGEACGC